MHCWWKCKLVQPLWKTVWNFLKKPKMELPFDPATISKQNTTKDIEIKTKLTVTREEEEDRGLGDNRKRAIKEYV